MNELQKIFNLPETRQDIQVYVSKIKETILNGENDPLQILKMLKVFELIIDELKTDPEIKSIIEIEADYYAEKTIEIYGCKFTKQERPYYDFSVCNDSELTSLNTQSAILKENIKEREAFLKVVPENFVNMETGEILTRPIKTIKSIIAVSVK
jgi:hypothetical protein